METADETGFPLMLPDATLPVPASLASLLAVSGPLFTAPSFRTFCGMACGFLAQTGRRTVCGMLAGAGLSRAWPHDRAHWFFSRARWSADDLGLAAAKLVVALLVPAGQPVTVAIDDTLARRRGKKVWAASWFHDGSAPGPAKTGYGNTWVIAAAVVKLPMISRPVAIPVLAKLVIKGTSSASRLWLARRMAGAIAGALPGRGIHVVADSAYAGGELKKLSSQVTWTTRLRKDAALHQLPPARTGRRGRPRTRGDRLPALAGLAATTTFTEVTVTRYGKAAGISAAALTCLWPSVFGTRAVTVVLIRDRSAAGYDLALVTTDTTATPAQVIERYAARWSIEVAIEDARQVFGAGQARNRTARAVERTIPFQLACQAIATCWYATAGHHPADAADHRARAPWYASKTQPSTADMAAKLRRVIIAARFKASRPDQPTPEEIRVIRLAWEDLAA
ncbi:MAG TPA: transposase [Streptosporangiaceae bacterium]|nr:transposase [Streptosporangiaceae bacterium]